MLSGLLIILTLFLSQFTVKDVDRSAMLCILWDNGLSGTTVNVREEQFQLKAFDGTVSNNRTGLLAEDGYENAPQPEERMERESTTVYPWFVPQSYQWPWVDFHEFQT